MSLHRTKTRFNMQWHQDAHFPLAFTLPFPLRVAAAFKKAFVPLFASFPLPVSWLLCFSDALDGELLPVILRLTSASCFDLNFPSFFTVFISLRTGLSLTVLSKAPSPGRFCSNEVTIQPTPFAHCTRDHC